MIRYVVTAIKQNGQRELAMDKNSRNAYDTPERAKEILQAIIENNSPDTVSQHVGKELQVRAVECSAMGDPLSWYVDNDCNEPKAFRLVIYRGIKCMVTNDFICGGKKIKISIVGNGDAPEKTFIVFKDEVVLYE